MRDDRIPARARPHLKDIHFKSARVPYVEPFGQLGGWALPGGVITRDEGEARAVAEEIYWVTVKAEVATVRRPASRV